MSTWIVYVIHASTNERLVGQVENNYKMGYNVKGRVKMKNWIVYFGLLLTVGFGVSFLIRLVRDGDFYIAEFTLTIIGIIILLNWYFCKKENYYS